jgi:hypothetical protein
MRRKLTIMVAEEVYEALHRVVGPRKIGRFIEDLVKPHIVKRNLESCYREMGRDEEGEGEAVKWAEAVIGGVGQPGL